MAKLVDVYPDGHEALVLLDAPIRTRFRHSVQAGRRRDDDAGRAGGLDIDLVHRHHLREGHADRALHIATSSAARALEVNEQQQRLPATTRPFIGAAVATNTVYMDNDPPFSLGAWGVYPTEKWGQLRTFRRALPASAPLERRSLRGSQACSSRRVGTRRRSGAGSVEAFITVQRNVASFEGSSSMTSDGRRRQLSVGWSVMAWVFADARPDLGGQGQLVLPRTVS